MEGGGGVVRGGEEYGDDGCAGAVAETGEARGGRSGCDGGTGCQRERSQ